MSDVQRLFEQLVTVLADRGAAELSKPFQVSELYQTLVPYRLYRRQLAFDSVEDYEMALLRLLAGEAGYVTLEPVEAREALVLETEAVSPDPGIVRDFAGARVRLNTQAARLVLAPDEAYAPPESNRMSTSPPPPVSEAIGATTAASPCPACGLELPADRQVNFCPACGQKIRAGICPVCGEDVEPEWRYCIRCGRPVGA